MTKKLIKYALIGGFTVFIWSLFSWMVLPWHAQSLHRFSDELEVAEVLQKNAPESGIYILPNTSHYSNRTPTKEIKRAQEILKKGPLMFASIELRGMKKMEFTPLLLSLCSCVLAAGIAAWMLLQTQDLCFLERAFFVALIGLLVAILGIFPAWNWWHFSTSYILVTCLDLLIGWTLAGLLMARLKM